MEQGQWFAMCQRLKMRRGSEDSPDILLAPSPGVPRASSCCHGEQTCFRTLISRPAGCWMSGLCFIPGASGS